MPKYSVVVPMWAHAYMDVEADSPEEAIDNAFVDEGLPQVCAQCSGWGRDWSLDLSDEGDWEKAEAEEI